MFYTVYTNVFPHRNEHSNFTRGVYCVVYSQGCCINHSSQWEIPFLNFV